MGKLQYQALTEEQVIASRTAHGSNRITQQKTKGFWRHFIGNFADPIIRILLAALIIQFILLLVQGGSWLEFGGIGGAVILSTFVSTLSEYGSEKAFRRMQQSTSDILCAVERAGGRKEVSIDELVAGDLVWLEAGDRIPADGMLISGKLSVDQSSLNGESQDAMKTPDTMMRTPGEIPCADPLTHPSCLVRGATVSGGSGCMVVLRVGDSTLYGSMMAEMQTDSRESPLKVRLTGLARTLSRLGYGAAVLVALSDLFNLLIVQNGLATLTAAGLLSHLLHALTLGITVVVMAVPEGLPMMITVVLSSNMLRMTRDNVLVRKLVGIETAGSLNILFTDKTGTLTRGKPETVSFCDGEMNQYPSFSRIPPKLSRLYALNCIHNSGCTLTSSGMTGGNATDRALLSFCLPLRERELLSYVRTETIPFDSTYKFSSAMVSAPGRGQGYRFVKGAPEVILEACDRCYDSDGNPIAFQNKTAARQKLHDMTAQAYRVIALAVSEHPVFSARPFSRLIFIGFAVIRDGLRPSAARSVAQLQKAGIQTVMITGDNRDTAAAIARECGILPSVPSKNSIMTGAELAAMTDEALRRALPDLRVVARALPADKSRLVRIAQQDGMVAAMTGDGVNDAPALKTADVGFAMGSGTEAAKEAGDICIRDDNIASIVRAVLYGRTIFRSIRKFIVFQLTMNLCAVGVSVAGSFIGIDTPITVIQMLWINIIMDTLAGLAFAGEAPRESYLCEPPLRRDEAVLNRSMTVQILWMGIFTIGMCVGFIRSEHMYERFRYMPNETCFLTAFFTLFVFCGLLNAFNARTERLNLFSGLFSNHAFLPVMGAAVLVQIAIVCLGGTVFRCVPLLPSEWKAVLAPAFLVIPADLARKCIRLLVRHRNARGAEYAESTRGATPNSAGRWNARGAAPNPAGHRPDLPRGDF